MSTQELSPALSQTAALRASHLEPLDERVQQPPTCKHHPEELATVLSEKFGFLCHQCNVYMHRTWRTANLKRVPVRELLDHGTAMNQQRVLHHFGRQPTDAGGVGSRGGLGSSHLLQGQDALQQLLAMETRAKGGHTARLINGEFVNSYSKEYRTKKAQKLMRQRQAAQLGSEVAVKLLQRWVRGSLARREVRRLRGAREQEEMRELAAIRIQGAARGRSERLNGRLAMKYHREREEKQQAAIRIQTASRGRLTRQQAHRREFSAMIIQRAWRGFWVRRQVGEGKQNAATIVIQASFRGHRARRHREDQIAAARAIQRVQRGKQGRKRVVGLSAARNAQKDREAAAATIQRLFRGGQARERVKTLRELSQKEMWKAAAKLVVEPRSPASSRNAVDPSEVYSPNSAGGVSNGQDDFPWEVLGLLHLRDLQFQDDRVQFEHERETMNERLQAGIESAVGVKEAELKLLREEKERAEEEMLVRHAKERQTIETENSTKQAEMKKQHDEETRKMQSEYEASRKELEKKLEEAQQGIEKAASHAQMKLEALERESLRASEMQDKELKDQQNIIAVQEAEKAKLLMEVKTLRKASEKAMLQAAESTGAGGANWTSRRKRLEDWKSKIMLLAAKNG